MLRKSNSLSEPSSSDGLKCIQLTSGEDYCLLLKDSIVHSDSFVLIYYKVCSELSKSADFSAIFSVFPYKQVSKLNISKCFIFRSNGRLS
jgi:hypothetical protein